MTVWPLEAASINAVLPVLSRASTGAPWWTRFSTWTVLPARAACCRACDNETGERASALRPVAPGLPPAAWTCGRLSASGAAEAAAGAAAWGDGPAFLATAPSDVAERSRVSVGVPGEADGVGAAGRGAADGSAMGAGDAGKPDRPGVSLVRRGGVASGVAGTGAGAVLASSLASSFAGGAGCRVADRADGADGLAASRVPPDNLPDAVGAAGTLSAGGAARGAARFDASFSAGGASPGDAAGAGALARR